MPLLGRQVHRVTPGRAGITYAKKAEQGGGDEENKAKLNLPGANGIIEKENDPQATAVPAVKAPAPPTKILADDRDVYVMRTTGEVFETYDDYLECHRSYAARKWTCRLTGVSNLTFEEALQSETKAGLYTEELPGTHVKPALEIVHHSLLSVDQLVRKIVSTFTGQLVPGESVRVGEKDYVVMGEADQERDPIQTHNLKNGTKNANFKLMEKDGGAILPCLARELIKRKKHPLNKQMVRKWLWDVAESKTVYENKHVDVRGSRKKQAWFVLEDLCEKFGLGKDLPPSLSFEPALSKRNREKKERQALREKRKLEHGQAAKEGPKRAKQERNPNAVIIRRGSMKHAAYEVLKNVGPNGLSVNEIMQRAQERGLRDFAAINAAYNKLFGSLSSSPNLFVKVDRGVFRLADKAGGEEAPVIVEGPPREPGEGAGRPAAEGGASGIEASGKPKESSMVRVAKAAIAKLEERVARAEEQVREVTSIIEIQSRERPKKIEVPAELIWNPELEIFTGDEYDRKAVVGHRKFVEQEKARLKSEAEAYVKERKNAEKRAKLANKQLLQKATGELHAARDQLMKAQKVLVKAESISLIKSGDYTAIQLTTDKDLQRELEREKALAEKKRLREEEKEQNRLRREREMEERRRAKEVANLERRFPLEDSALALEISKMRERGLDIEEPRPLPEVKEVVDGTFVKILSVAACLCTFGKMLGMAPLKAHELVETVKVPGPRLASLYRDLLSVLLLDGSQHPSGLRRIRRWVYTMTSEWGAIAWPDVLARYILTKPNVDDATKRAAEQLRTKEYQKIEYESHVELLCFLLDDVVETRTVHFEVDRWQEEREDLLSQKRECRMELNRKRRERAEAAKEERRRKEEERKQRREDAEKAREAARERGEDPDAAAAEFEANSDGGEDGEDDELRFQIPEDQVEYSGDPMDRKGVLAHRKWVEQERQRLQRAFEQHIREKNKKEREEQSRLKEEKKQIEQEQSTHDRTQDFLDRELDKRPIRQHMLGRDRKMVKYYWNVAGQKAAVYAEIPHTGEWRCFTDAVTLEGFLAALDERGQRESVLLDNLARRQAPIKGAFGKDGEDVSSKPSSRPQRSSTRVASLKSLSNGGTTSNAGGGDGFSSGSQDSDALDNVQDSLEFLGHEMESIAITAEKCGVPYSAADEEMAEEGEEEAKQSPGGWKPWLLAMRAALKDEGGVSSTSMERLLLDMEHSIWLYFPNAEEAERAAMAGNPAAESELRPAELMENSSSDEEIDERSLEGFARMKRKMRQKLLWFSNAERDAWRDLVEQSKTVSQLGYCAAVLEQRLTIVQRTMKKRGGTRKPKAESS
ncbi:WAC domain-containing protein [Chloropicon roscoffensis]|uniref:WAC domain-containing protein n=1 Tax=Chloropicon roscoffensis TaxID=1461544 RepID=A0AAX4PIL2_9CHLO